MQVFEIANGHSRVAHSCLVKHFTVTRWHVSLEQEEKEVALGDTTPPPGAHGGSTYDASFWSGTSTATSDVLGSAAFQSTFSGCIFHIWNSHQRMVFRVLLAHDRYSSSTSLRSGGILERKQVKIKTAIGVNTNQIQH